MLVDILTAAREDGAPTAPDLQKLSRRSRPPAYISFDSGKVFVDITHKAWKEMLKRNLIKRGVPSESSKKSAGAQYALEEKSLQAETLLPIEKLKKIKLANRKLRIELERQKGNLIPYEIANWLFLNFMESTNTELLRIPKKHEAEIVNFCRDNSPHSIIDLFNRAVAVAIHTVKTNQKKALQDWKKDLENEV